MTWIGPRSSVGSATVNNTHFDTILETLCQALKSVLDAEILLLQPSCVSSCLRGGDRVRLVVEPLVQHSKGMGSINHMGRCVKAISGVPFPDISYILLKVG